MPLEKNIVSEKSDNNCKCKTKTETKNQTHKSLDVIGRWIYRLALLIMPLILVYYFQGNPNFLWMYAVSAIFWK